MARSRGVYRSIYSRIFDDPDFQRLSARARHVLLTARQCEQAGPAAIFRYYPELLARQTGYPVRQVKEALKELERETWLVHDEEVLWVRNGLRYDPVGLRSPNFRISVEAWLNDLPHSSRIVASFRLYYHLGNGSETVTERLSNRSAPKEQEQEQEQEQETTGGGAPTTADSEHEGPPSGDPATRNGVPIPPRVLEKIPDLVRWPAPTALVALWNFHAQQVDLPLVETLSQGRTQRATARLREFPDWRWWNGALSKMRGSKFLMGDRPPGPGHSAPFRAHFDWLLATKDGVENVVALHDGKYDR